MEPPLKLDRLEICVRFSCGCSRTFRVDTFQDDPTPSLANTCVHHQKTIGEVTLAAIEQITEPPPSNPNQPRIDPQHGGEGGST